MHMHARVPGMSFVPPCVSLPAWHYNPSILSPTASGPCSAWLWGLC